MTTTLNVGQFHIPEERHSLDKPHGWRGVGGSTKPGVILLVRSGERAISMHHSDILIEADALLTVAQACATEQGLDIERGWFQLVGFWGNNHSEPPVFLIVYHAKEGVEAGEQVMVNIEKGLLDLVLRMKVRDQLGFNFEGRLAVWTTSIEDETLRKMEEEKEKRGRSKVPLPMAA